MTSRFSRIRRFRFNLPQRIAAVFLALFLIQGLWLTSRQTLSDRDYDFARCGRETWEGASALAGYYTTCGNIKDGIVVYRLAGLPLTLNFELERLLDHFRKPEDRVVQPGGQDRPSDLSSWELRHQLTHVLLLLRLPFLGAGCILGAGLWWVTRRLYGNLGGYTALALYCFSPSILRVCVTPSAEILPRTVLLIAAFGVAAASHIAALPVVALLGLAAMLWVAEGNRSQVLPIILAAVCGALLLLFACYGFSLDAASYVFRSAAGFLSFSFDPARRFFSTLPNAGVTVAAGAALLLLLGLKKARYFGNTAPLLCALVLFLLVTTGVPGSPWLWALPVLLTFIGGVFADAFEGPRGRMAMAAAGAVVLLQAVLCVLSLPGLL
jgi:hypothetical protein